MTNLERRRNNRSKMTRMLELKPWLAVNGLTLLDFARGIEVPLRTAEGWVNRGVVPSTAYQGKLTEYLHEHCAHYWVIAVPDGPISEGVCQLCGQVRGFNNSVEYTPMYTNRGNPDKVIPGKSAA